MGHDPSQDLTISPSYYTNLGYGSDFEYRYALNRYARGQWFVSYLQQTTLPNVSGVTDTGQSAKEARALITGTHTQQVTQDLLLRVNANLVSDPDAATQQLAACASQPNRTRQPAFAGNAYLLGQYPATAVAQILSSASEVGYLPNLSLFTSPCCRGDTNAYFPRRFTRTADHFAGTSTDVLMWAVVFTPQVKFREVYYRAHTGDSSLTGNVLGGLDATSKTSRFTGMTTML